MTIIVYVLLSRDWRAEITVKTIREKLENRGCRDPCRPLAKGGPLVVQRTGQSVTALHRSHIRLYSIVATPFNGQLTQINRRLEYTQIETFLGTMTCSQNDNFRQWSRKNVNLRIWNFLKVDRYVHNKYVYLVKQLIFIFLFKY